MFGDFLVLTDRWTVDTHIFSLVQYRRGLISKRGKNVLEVEKGLNSNNRLEKTNILAMDGSSLTG